MEKEKTVRYLGHTITGPDDMLGYYNIKGPASSGGAPTLSGAKNMVRWAIKQKKCGDTSPGHHVQPGASQNPRMGYCVKCQRYLPLSYGKPKA